MNNLKEESHWVLQLITISIYAIFAASVVYNFSYFLGLGISLSQIPLSISDVINSAITWSPFVLCAVIAEIIIIGVLIPYHQEKTKNSSFSLVKNIQLKKRTDKIIKLLSKLVVITAIITILLIGQVDNSLSEAFIILSLLLLLGFARLMRSNIIKNSKKNKRIVLYIFMSILVVISIFMFGYITSAKALARKNFDGAIYLKNEPSKKIPVIMLSNLDKGIIIMKIGDKHATFVPWGEIYKIEEKIKKMRFQGFLCKFGLLCQKYFPNT